MSSRFHFSPRPNRAAEIVWHEWNVDAFALAERECKPILLAISAVWCHWCHVMDETTYSDDAVIALVNERFVAVRVEGDRRPDINARYTMGGWPTTAFLTPGGEMLTGTTYVPPEKLAAMLAQVADFYSTHAHEIRERNVDSATLAPSPLPDPDPAALDPIAAERIVASLVEAYDEVHGGFGTAPKFPQSEALELLLLEYRYAKHHGETSSPLLDLLVRTALGMARGGMYDHAEGGFFRYSTTRDWSIPHFEKMAEDHAGLLRFYAGLYDVTRLPALRETLVSATRYVRTVLRDPSSALFGGSQDADEAYFSLSLDERRKRAAPYVDRTSYTNWSGALASALLVTGRVLDDDAVTSDGVAALDAIHSLLLAPCGTPYHVFDRAEGPQVEGLLTDAVAYLRALLDAHECTGEARFYARALTQAEAIETNFAAPEGAYIDRLPGSQDLGRLAYPDRPLVENAMLADTLLRLAVLDGDERYRTRAARTLAAFARLYESAGSLAAPYARAVRRYFTTACAVRLVGSVTATRALREAALDLPDPLRTVRTIQPADGAQAAAAYVCVGTLCGPPAFDATSLREVFEALALQVGR